MLYLPPHRHLNLLKPTPKHQAPQPKALYRYAVKVISRKFSGAFYFAHHTKHLRYHSVHLHTAHLYLIAVGKAKVMPAVKPPAQVYPIGAAFYLYAFNCYHVTKSLQSIAAAVVTPACPTIARVFAMPVPIVMPVAPANPATSDHISLTETSKTFHNNISAVTVVNHVKHQAASFQRRA